MVLSRAWLFRASVAGNLLLLTYVALYTSSEPPVPSLSSGGNSGVSSSSSSHSPVTLPLRYPAQPAPPEPLTNPNPNYPLPLEESGDKSSPSKDQPQEIIKGDNRVVWDGDDSALGEGIAADLVSREFETISIGENIRPFSQTSSGLATRARKGSSSPSRGAAERDQSPPISLRGHEPPSPLCTKRGLLGPLQLCQRGKVVSL